MYNIAEKELREAMAYLEKARNTHQAILAIQRALELGQPVEVSFRTPEASFTTMCPAKASEKLLTKLEQQASTRVMKLEEQEVYWCQEVAFEDQQHKLNMALRDNRDKSINDLLSDSKTIQLKPEEAPTPPAEPVRRKR